MVETTRVLISFFTVNIRVLNPVNTGAREGGTVEDFQGLRGWDSQLPITPLWVKDSDNCSYLLSTYCTPDTNLRFLQALPVDLMIFLI